jgi:TRAP-type C4-dicarboxylate transport system permease small subunit
LFNAPIPLTSAIVTEYYMIAVALLPLAAGEYRNAHTSVDLLVSRLPAGPRAALDVLVRLLCVVVYLVLAGQGLQLALEKYASNAYLLEQTSRIVVWPAYFLVPVGFAAIALLVAVKLACLLLRCREPVAGGEAGRV